MRAPLHLVIDAADILADHAHYHHLDPGEGRDHDDQRDVAGRVHSLHQGDSDDPGGVGEGDGHQHHPQVQGGAQRLVVEGEQPVESVVEKFPDRPGGAALLTDRILVFEGRRPESDPGEQALGEAVVLGEFEDRVDGTPGQQPEVADPVDQLHVHQAVDQRVVGAGAERAGDAVALAVTAGDHLVVAVGVLLQHAADELGRVLEIRVHDDDRIAVGVLEAGEHGGFLAEVATEGEIADPRVGSRQLLQDRQRAVSTAVVDVDDLEFVRQPAHFVRGTRMEAFEDLLLVETRHY